MILVWRSKRSFSLGAPECWTRSLPAGASVRTGCKPYPRRAWKRCTSTPRGEILAAPGLLFASVRARAASSSRSRSQARWSAIFTAGRSSPWRLLGSLDFRFVCRVESFAPEFSRRAAGCPSSRFSSRGLLAALFSSAVRTHERRSPRSTSTGWSSRFLLGGCGARRVEAAVSVKSKWSSWGEASKTSRGSYVNCGRNTASPARSSRSSSEGSAGPASNRAAGGGSRWLVPVVHGASRGSDRVAAIGNRIRESAPSGGGRLASRIFFESPSHQM